MGLTTTAARTPLHRLRPHAAEHRGAPGAPGDMSSATGEPAPRPGHMGRLTAALSVKYGQRTQRPSPARALARGHPRCRVHPLPRQGGHGPAFLRGQGGGPAHGQPPGPVRGWAGVSPPRAGDCLPALRPWDARTPATPAGRPATRGTPRRGDRADIDHGLGYAARGTRTFWPGRRWTRWTWTPFVTTRHGGVSAAPHAATLNLGLDVGDFPADVLVNRRRVAAALGAWLGDFVFCNQAHGRRCRGRVRAGPGPRRAPAWTTRSPPRTPW